ncbi:hypothetical protein, partial [Neisseria mucosa]|uniref:hypothetical protein n=1 Tax=Neisseria mucosa TaxID=488 RepID=UPI0027E0ED92
EAAKNRTIPPSSKTVNSQTAKNSTKTDNNLKFNNFYFKSTNTKGRLKSLSDDLCYSISHHILLILLIQKIFTLLNITSPR